MIKSRLPIILLILVSAFLVSACQPQLQIPKHQGQEPPERPLAPVSGSIVDNLNAIYSDEAGVEDCDLKEKDIRYELAKAIEARQDEIAKFASKQKTDVYERRKIGPTYFRFRIKQEEIKDEWINDVYGTWREFYDDYLKIKDTPTDGSWVQLSSSVKSLLAIDEWRIKLHEDLIFDKDSGPLLKKAFNTTKTCLNNQSCEDFSFDEEFTQLLSKGRYLGKFYASYKTAVGRTARWKALDVLADELEYYKKQYEFIMEPTISLKEGELILPLSANDYAGVEEKMAQLIEPVWRSPDIALKIVWADHLEAGRAYKLIAEPNWGELSRMSREKRIVRLFQDTRANAVAHEIGHVLGFQDRYYTFWKKGECRYLDQYNSADIMSDSALGKPLSEYWQTLKENYGTPRNPKSAPVGVMN